LLCGSGAVRPLAVRVRGGAPLAVQVSGMWLAACGSRKGPGLGQDPPRRGCRGMSVRAGLYGADVGGGHRDLQVHPGCRA
jgi:hypothetical protein